MDVRPKELERKHLEEAVAEILHMPLVIVTAPSGYGKTTIVKSFFKKHKEMTELWLSLGCAEVDEAWVWQRLCGTIKDKNYELHKVLVNLGLPETAQEIAYFIAVLRENCFGPACLILDDYHECNGPAIDKLIERVVYEEIPNLHFLIISRTYPDFACEELMLKGYCTVVDQQMLVLSRKETEAVFRINNIILSEVEAKRVYEYTDGWIAAVYLALHAYKRAGRFDNITNIRRLLKTAIFDKMSRDIQELLIKMSLFESFTLEEASYIVKKEITMVAVSQAQEQFGFMQHDDDTDSYTMHALLQSVASSERERLGIDKRDLYLRCGEYKESKGEYIDAIVNYRNAEADTRILQILSGDVRGIIYELIPDVIQDIFENITMEKKLAYYPAYLGYIYNLIVKDDEKLGGRLYQEVLEKYRDCAFCQENYKQIEGELYAIGAFLHFNDLCLMNEELKKSYQILGNSNSSTFQNALLSFGNPFVTALYYRESGQLKNTIKMEKEYARYYFHLVKGMNGDWDILFDAEYALMTYDIEKAMSFSKRIVETATLIKETCIVISGYYVYLRCLIHQGRDKEFYQVMDEFEKVMREVVRPVLITDYEVACGYIYALIGRVDLIPDWLRKFCLDDCSRMMRNVRNGCVVYSIYLCRQKKWELLDAVAEQILVPYERTWHSYVQIFGYIFKSIAVYHREGMDKAYSYVKQAVDMAVPDNLRIPFVEMGNYLLPVMEKMEGENAFCTSLLKDMRSYKQKIVVFQDNQEKAVLSKREMEIMEYVRLGMRNSEISDRMHIALVTVEKSLTSIYRKLNVSNRAGAIARMEEMEEI